MKFVCEKSLLSEAISNASRAVAAKSSVPVMEGILIEAKDELIITGYDLSLGIEVTVPANVEERGKVVVNAKIIADIIRLLPDEPVSFETDSNLVAKIKCKNVEHELLCMSEENYPDLPSEDVNYSINVPENELKMMIAQTVFAISGDESKPVHTGSLFDVENNKLTVVSVDGFRLSYRSSNIENESEESEFSFVVPGMTLKEIEKFCGESDETANITVGRKQITFKIGRAKIISRILEGDFLNYKNAVPKDGSFSVKVNRRDLIIAIERVSILISERIKNPIHMNFEGNKLSLSCRTPLGSSKDECSLLNDSETLEIGFNHKYLLDALRACPDDEVLLSLNSHITPIVITPTEGEEYLHLILPVRLKAD